MLTPKTLKKLQEEQKKLDEFIVQKNNITDNFKTGKSFIRTKIALLAQEELIDCLHFYLSWINAFQIDFADYNFKKFALEPDYNELLLALFSETEAFKKEISELNPKDKDYQKILANYKKAKEKQQEIIAKMSNNFLEEIKIEKNKAKKELTIFVGKLEKIRSNQISLELLKGLIISYGKGKKPLKEIASLRISPNNELVVRSFEPGLTSLISKTILDKKLGYKVERITKEEVYFTLTSIATEDKEKLIKEVKLITEGGKKEFRIIHQEIKNWLKKASGLSQDQKKNYEKQSDEL
ncbi:16978_t:CDS:2, partial [Racocetra persica]